MQGQKPPHHADRSQEHRNRGSDPGVTIRRSRTYRARTAHHVTNAADRARVDVEHGMDRAHRLCHAVSDGLIGAPPDDEVPIAIEGTVGAAAHRLKVARRSDTPSGYLNGAGVTPFANPVPDAT